MRDDKLSIAPCSKFVNLVLVSKASESISLDMDSIVVTGSRFILVEAPAGMGKSTLSWELCTKWDSLKSLEDYAIVLLLKLRECRIQNAATVSELFHHSDKALSQGVVDEVLMSEGEGVLLVLDGFDEMPASIANSKSSLIMDVIGGKCLPAATRLVTSRPSALHHKEECFPVVDRHIKILGFTDECIQMYAELAFQSEPDVLTHFKNFIFSNPIIKSLMYVPVNCAIISQVYKDIKATQKLMPRTMTELYTTLVLVLIRRHMIERGEWDQYCTHPSDLKALPVRVLSDLKKISATAFRGLFKRSTQLAFTESEVGQGFQHLGLLDEVKEMYVVGPSSTYSFLHLSIQEFLAAWHVSCHPELFDYVSRLVRKSQQVRHNFGLFIAGLIGCNRYIFKGITSYMISCMYEAQDCSRLKNISPSDAESGHFSVYLSGPVEMYAFGYVLVCAPIPWSVMLIDVPIDVLTSSLSEHSCLGKVQGSIVNLTVNSVFRMLHLNFEAFSLNGVLQFITHLNLQYVANSFLAKIGNSIACLVQLQSITLINLNYGPSSMDYLFYQSLQSNSKLKKLSLEFSHISLKGIQKLSSSIANSHSLEHIKLQYVKYSNYCRVPPKDCDPYLLFTYEEANLHSVVKAALSCSTVKTLTTNIPFQVSNSEVISGIEHMFFATTPVHYFDTNPVALFDCLQCIAGFCQQPTMKSLVISYTGSQKYDMDIPLDGYENFLTLLNKSLHLNSSMCGLHLDSNILTYHGLDRIPNFLRKDRDVELARCHSLPEINLCEGDHRDVNSNDADDSHSEGGSYCDSSDEEWFWASSHDLSFDMHPLLFHAFQCSMPDMYWHNSDCDHPLFLPLYHKDMFMM